MEYYALAVPRSVNVHRNTRLTLPHQPRAAKHHAARRLHLEVRRPMPPVASPSMSKSNTVPYGVPGNGAHNSSAQQPRRSQFEAPDFAMNVFERRLAHRFVPQGS